MVVVVVWIQLFRVVMMILRAPWVYRQATLAEI